MRSPAHRVHRCIRIENSHAPDDWDPLRRARLQLQAPCAAALRRRVQHASALIDRQAGDLHHWDDASSLNRQIPFANARTMNDSQILSQAKVASPWQQCVLMPGVLVAVAHVKRAVACDGISSRAIEMAGIGPRHAALTEGQQHIGFGPRATSPGGLASPGASVDAPAENVAIAARSKPAGRMKSRFLISPFSAFPAWSSEIACMPVKAGFDPELPVANGRLAVAYPGSGKFVPGERSRMRNRVRSIMHLANPAAFPVPARYSRAAMSQWASLYFCHAA